MSTPSAAEVIAAEKQNTKVGYLYKKSHGILKKWKRFVCKLEGHLLICFKNPEDTIGKRIPLVNCTIEKADHKTNKHYTFVIYNEDSKKSWVFQAGAQSDCDEWISKIQKSAYFQSQLINTDSATKDEASDSESDDGKYDSKSNYSSHQTPQISVENTPAVELPPETEQKPEDINFTDSVGNVRTLVRNRSATDAEVDIALQKILSIVGVDGNVPGTDNQKTTPGTPGRDNSPNVLGETVRPRSGSIPLASKNTPRVLLKAKGQPPTLDRFRDFYIEVPSAKKDTGAFAKLSQELYIRIMNYLSYDDICKLFVLNRTFAITVKDYRDIYYPLNLIRDNSYPIYDNYGMRADVKKSYIVSKWWKGLTSEEQDLRTIVILVAGDGRVGKSTFIKNFLRLPLYKAPKREIEMDEDHYGFFYSISSIWFYIDIIDAKGRDIVFPNGRSRMLESELLARPSVFIIMYDASEPDFLNTAQHIREIYEHTKNEETPIIVIGNKSDKVPKDLKNERRAAIESHMASNIKLGSKIFFFECSTRSKIETVENIIAIGIHAIIGFRGLGLRKDVSSFFSVRRKKK